MKFIFTFVFFVSISKFSFCTKSSRIEFSQSSKSFISNTKDSIYSIVDTSASFKGGMTAWVKHVQKYLNPNIGSKNGAKDGTYKVKIRFVVTKDGEVKNCIPVTQHNYGFEDEAIKVIKFSPKWVPAKLNGVNVSSWTELVITFVNSSD